MFEVLAARPTPDRPAGLRLRGVGRISHLSWSPIYFFAMTGALLTSGLAGLLHWLFPLAATILAYILYRRKPITYISFVWWLWFLSPFIRRIVDYRSAWMDPNPILLAPPLATLACLPTLFREGSRIAKPEARPFLLAFVSVGYGFLMGLLRVPVTTFAMSSLNWLAPLVFGFFLFSTFKMGVHNKAVARTLFRTFSWGVLIMGVYGIIQIIIAPGWDQMWMVNSGMESIGSPEPFAIRVFSTMNAPGPLGAVLVAGILILAVQSGGLAIFSASAGCMSVALSLARSNWLALIVGTGILALRNKKSRSNLIKIAILLVCLGSLLGFLAPLKDTIADRLQTFQHLDEDESYIERHQANSMLTTDILSQPFGGGLGSLDIRQGPPLSAHDNGVGEILYSLGWFGGIVYIAGLVSLARPMIFVSTKDSAITIVSAAICLGLLAEFFLSSVFLNVVGMLFWAFAGIYRGSSKACSVDQ